MPYFIRGNARIYYEDIGRGDPVIMVHGLVENTTYWSLLGITGMLADTCRAIPIDMRGHGRTAVSGNPFGFDADTVGADIIALADHLKLGRFHLVSHSAGGFASVRQAMKDSSRFATLILTNTASATSTRSGDRDTIRAFYDKFARSIEDNTWDEVIANVKKYREPLFRGIVESEHPKELLRLFRQILELNDRTVIGAFVRSYFTDPDPRVDGLRGIGCPVLIIIGEKDDLFLQPSRLMAREIPGARIIEYEGIGHITALEAPGRLAADMIEFIKKHPV